jgi:hypothetical protein
MTSHPVFSSRPTRFQLAYLLGALLASVIFVLQASTIRGFSLQQKTSRCHHTRFNTTGDAMRDNDRHCLSSVAAQKIDSVEEKIAQASTYWRLRKDSPTYNVLFQTAKREAPDALTVLDVGAYESPFVTRLDWIPTKVATDIQARPEIWEHVDGVAFIQGDFMQLKFGTRYDLVLCSQVVEHLADEVVENFVTKMACPLLLCSSFPRHTKCPTVRSKATFKIPSVGRSSRDGSKSLRSGVHSFMSLSRRRRNWATPMEVHLWPRTFSESGVGTRAKTRSWDQKRSSRAERQRLG